ncbi:MAG: hypothetical protein J7L45_01435 [Candidatus Aenigmarchaeota archaeon]|nr:hypothetical protein [Candidatus Aenigmarchaeota archaeon]
MPKEKVCVHCKRFVEGDVCPACKTSEFTRRWEGMVIVIDPDSEIAKTLEINAPGKYAISIIK